MARTHSRSPSRSDYDTANTIKRLKVSHPNTVLVPTDPVSQFSNGLLEPNNVERLHDAYNANGPFKYCLVEKLFQDDLLKKVTDECLSELSFTEKETDIYKVNQTGDLASLNYLSSSQISLLPNLLNLRDALYSSQFRSFLREVTGCGPLSGTKQDMSVNSYTNSCHLLNHDDVIGTRRVSYILYMPLPHYQLWPREWGGALELYPVVEAEGGGLEPECVPRKTIPPSWNQFIFFEVQPGYSFHSVEEVVVGGEGEDGRQRLSVSGWFHSAQEGEEGYEPEVNTEEVKSSREQLASTSTVFTSYPVRVEDDKTLTSTTLSEEHVTFLSEFLNPVYLQPRTMNALATRFVEESSLELHSFLKNDLAEALEPKLRALDAKDGLGPERAGLIPPHDAGVNIALSTSNASLGASEGVSTITITTTQDQSSTWTLKGPPHKWRYCALLPPDQSAPTSHITPLSAHPSASEILRTLQDELFPSEALRAWIALVTRLLPLRYQVEARRFRPGLDYTLATSEDKEARLDISLGLTPNVKQSENDTKSAPYGWSAAEWGGWECYMAPHDEEDDPAVYRTSARTHHKVHNETEDGEPTTNGEHHVGEAGGEEEDEEMEEALDDGTLLTVQPGYNRLLLVLRDERVMRFVKYVSAAAEGSRWDVCGEYEIGVLQEDEEEDE